MDLTDKPNFGKFFNQSFFPPILSETRGKHKGELRMKNNQAACLRRKLVDTLVAKEVGQRGAGHLSSEEVAEVLAIHRENVGQPYNGRDPDFEPMQ